MFWQKKETAREADVDALRRENAEMRTRFEDLKQRHEKLHDSFSDLKSSMLKYGAVGSAVVIMLSVLGISKYSEIKGLMDKALTARLDKSVGRYEQFQRALFLLNNSGQPEAAEVILLDLLKNDPYDELAFLNVLECYTQLLDFEKGYQVIQQAEKKRLFPTRCQDLLSFNNTAAIMIARFATDTNRLSEALRWLVRAETMGNPKIEPDRRYPLFNQIVAYLLVGNEPAAREAATKLHALAGNIDDEEDAWMKAVFEQRPEIRGKFFAIVEAVNKNAPAN
jgi:tetratricopeptide (TPR) repeat protein